MRIIIERGIEHNKDLDVYFIGFQKVIHRENWNILIEFYNESEWTGKTDDS